MPLQKFTASPCSTVNKNPITPLQENKCKYIYNNPQRVDVCVTRVDGCLITEGKKCDFLLINCHSKAAYFVELKGSDLFAAVEQINETLNKLKDDLTHFSSIHARIVLTKSTVPNLENNPTWIKFQKRFKGLKGTVQKKSIQLEESA